MPFSVPRDEAERAFPQYRFVAALTPSEQKCAFHVNDAKGTSLCLKIISPDYPAERLEREIEALISVDHPNVVQFNEYHFSVTKQAHSHYIVEHFVPGTDLSTQLNGQPWELNRAKDFFSHFFDGLAELKKHGLVHRDLKPSNIRVRLDGQPVIIDFGLARHLNRSDLTKTAHGAGIGTPLYFAPEQFFGTKHDIDYRTDLFAGGILLYTAIVGEHPFDKPGMTFPELESAVCNSHDYRNTVGFQNLPQLWQILVARLLEKDRARRPNDPAQVVDLLKKVGKAQ